MNPDYHDVRTLMANTFAWQHRYGDAKTEFNEVIRRSPKYGDAYFGLARVEYWNGNFEGALKQIDRTIELLPSDPFARILKAKIRISLGQDREAMKEVEFVLKSPGSPAAAEAKELKNKFNNGTLH